MERRWRKKTTIWVRRNGRSHLRAYYHQVPAVEVLTRAKRYAGNASTAWMMVHTASGDVDGTWEWDKEDAYDSVLSWLEARMKGYHDIEIIDTLKLTGTAHTPRDLRPEFIEQARDAGRRLAAR